MVFNPPAKYCYAIGSVADIDTLQKTTMARISSVTILTPVPFILVKIVFGNTLVNRK